MNAGAQLAVFSYAAQGPSAWNDVAHTQDGSSRLSLPNLDNPLPACLEVRLLGRSRS